MFTRTNKRRSRRRTTSPYNSLNPIAGTTHRSTAAIRGAWLRRNVLHPRDGGSRLCLMYLATVDCAMVMPSLRSSLWIRGTTVMHFTGTTLK
jgi:hypothetical protein